MKELYKVWYKELGDEGYYAMIENSKSMAVEEFFEEDWGTLLDRVGKSLHGSWDED